MGDVVVFDRATHRWRTMSNADDAVVAVKAAQVTANMFGEPAVIMFDLSVKRESELVKGDYYLEKVRPDAIGSWMVDD